MVCKRTDVQSINQVYGRLWCVLHLKSKRVNLCWLWKSRSVSYRVIINIQTRNITTYVIEMDETFFLVYSRK